MYTSYDAFITEQLESYVKLYRGDSTYIDKFDYAKFDETAIYGLGLYLTDNKRVAYSYTLKGDADPVVTELFADSNKQKYAELCFIITELLNEVNQTNFSRQELYDAYNAMLSYDTHGKELENKYNQGDKLFWLNAEYVKSLTPREVEDRMEDFSYWVGRVEKNQHALNAIHKKFDGYIAKATAYYNAHKRDYEFLYDGKESWKVILKSKNKGHISEFLVNSKIVNNCYNANATIPDGVTKILKNVIRQYVKKPNVAEYLKNSKFYNKNNPFQFFIANIENNTNPDNITLANFLYDNSIFRTKETCIDASIWKYFIIEMQKLGYDGIVYDGGEHLNSPIKHKAYVIWNLDNVKRVS